MKTYVLSFLYLIFISLPATNIAQPKMILKGRVFEMVKGKPTGISNISVYIQDVNYDITNERGEFSIPFSTDKNFVFINFDKNFNRQLISPSAGRIDLPVYKSVDVIVCGQENKRLREEVDKLTQKVKSFQTKYQFSEKKASETYKEMLDTILHFEQRIQVLDAQKEKIQAQSSAEIQRLQIEIDRLKSVEESLLKQLLEAKDEYFLKKQACLLQITADLRQYLDALQNLQMMVMPERIPQYFDYNDAAAKKLSGKIDIYNDARDAILKNQDANLTATRHYWEDPSVSNQLQETYQFLLNDIHIKNILPLELSIVNNLKDFQTHKLGRIEAKKAAQKAASEAFPSMKAVTPILEEKVNATALKLKQFF